MSAWATLLLFCLCSYSYANDNNPVIAVIIDDMGFSQERGERALQLPGALTYAFLPHTPHATGLARKAHRSGKEVMLHLPMEPREEDAKDRGLLTSGMSENQIRRLLLSNIAAVPHVVGVNNHRGSLLTSKKQTMSWVMEGLRAFGLYFIDSRTSPGSIAESVARKHQVATAGRDIFLDHFIDERFITRQFNKLIRRAQRHGTAIGIGHPHPETLSVLERELPRLKKLGIRLVSASTLTKAPERREKLWQASSSPLPKVAKNSKPLP